MKSGHAAAKTSPPDHNILDAVRNGDGEFFVRYGDDERSVWLDVAGVVQNSPEILRRLSAAGIHLASGHSREAFKRRVERHEHYRDSHIVRHVGWITDNAYRHGDGSIEGRATAIDHAGVIVDIQRNARFACRGTIDEWKAANTPFLLDQPLVQIIYAYALTGYLIGFAPLDFQNPILEIVGDHEKGKTSLAVGAGSICGGDPRNLNGYCRSWDRTAATFDSLERAHRDNLLVLNEANLTGKEAKDQADFMRTAIMRFTEPGERESMNTTGPPLFSRLALLSTSNTSIAELIGGASRTDGAMRSRVVTLFADRPFGIFDTLPSGFASASDAVRAMVARAAIFYGTAGRAFVGQLCRYRRGAVTGAIVECFTMLKSSSILHGIDDERSIKTLALCLTAYRLAKQFDVFPRECGTFSTLLRRLYASTGAVARSGASSPRETVLTYLRKHAAEIIDSDTLAHPLPKATVGQTPGFWIEGGKRCLIPAEMVGRIPNHTAVLKMLRGDDDLDCEPDRLTKKVSSAICHPSEYCRGYFINITRSEAQMS